MYEEKTRHFYCNISFWLCTFPQMLKHNAAKNIKKSCVEKKTKNIRF